MPFTESDWKYMRSLHDKLLNRLCERIESELTAIMADKSKSAHERYLAIYSHIHEADDDVGRGFNDWRRSTILDRTRAIKALGLMTEEDIAGLSERARESLE